MKHRFLAFLFVLFMFIVFLVSCGDTVETTTKETQKTTSATLTTTTAAPITTDIGATWEDKIKDFQEVGKETALARAAKTPDNDWMVTVTLTAPADASLYRAFLKTHAFRGHLYGKESFEGVILYLPRENELQRLAELPEVTSIDILTETDTLAWMRKVVPFYIELEDESALYDPNSNLYENLVYGDDGRFKVSVTVSEQLSDSEKEALIENIGLEGTVSTYYLLFWCTGVDDLKKLASCEAVVAIELVYYITNC